ncbi:hypothetical protein M4S82_04020 [Planococcus sp. MERTA32b]|nr:hypothetical protein [Planococcus sp. MER TA 32b]
MIRKVGLTLAAVTFGLAGVLANDGFTTYEDNNSATIKGVSGVTVETANPWSIKHDVAILWPQPWSIKRDVAILWPQPWSIKRDVAILWPQPWSVKHDVAILWPQPWSAGIKA